MAACAYADICRMSATVGDAAADICRTPTASGGAANLHFLPPPGKFVGKSLLFVSKKRRGDIDNKEKQAASRLRGNRSTVCAGTMLLPGKGEGVSGAGKGGFAEKASPFRYERQRGGTTPKGALGLR